MNSAVQVLTLARRAGLTISTAESCTGGMVAAALTEISGASDVFERGFITYSNSAKREMLDVAVATLKIHGAVSEPVAREMVLGALAHSSAGLAVAVTGIAGPGGSDHKPEGRVCFAVGRTGEQATSQTIEFGRLGRANVRQAATEHALDLLLKALT